MCLYPITVKVRPKDGREPFMQTVSCGKCLECLRQHSIEWAFRILDESSLHKDNCFITLTYNNDNLPNDGSVSRREVQLFIKRLRDSIKPLRIRFFACGEYGKKLGRPHYHLIIFGWKPDDMYFFQKDGKTDLFRSPKLEKLWTKGFSSVGKLTYDSAIYCAKYMNKWDYNYALKHGGSPVRAPFVQMSNRPGIGYGCVYRCDLQSDRIYRSGKSTKIPRYYLKVLERDGIFLDEFKIRRACDGEHIASITDIFDKRKKFNDMFLSRKYIKK